MRAELLHASAFARVHIDRHWDWLTEAQRLSTLDMLSELSQRFGGLPLPGSADPLSQTVRTRAQAHAYELEQLHFDAVAPVTAGVDLAGDPFDLAESSGGSWCSTSGPASANPAWPWCRTCANSWTY